MGKGSGLRSLDPDPPSSFDSLSMSGGWRFPVPVGHHSSKER
jgi:hypothetical protein